MSTEPTIDALATVALRNLSRPYPYNAQHLQLDAQDVPTPEEIHPAFATSFDWHSSVHMHWLLASLTEFTAQTEGLYARRWHGAAIDTLTAHLSAENIAAEVDYLLRHPSWERPYGWAWSAQLADALALAATEPLRALAAHTAPLRNAVFRLTLEWLPRTPAAVRHGVHANTAFGLRRIRRAATAAGRQDVVTAIDTAARRFFLPDTAWAFAQERSGQDFLSAGFCEADLMIEVLDADTLAAWLPAFLSTLTPSSPVLAPVAVLDPTDGYQSHLNGLGLTAAASALRVAQALRELPAAAPANGAAPGHASGMAPEALATALTAAVPVLMAPGLAAAVSDEYMDSHWLASFAWEALCASQHPLAHPRSDSAPIPKEHRPFS